MSQFVSFVGIQVMGRLNPALSAMNLKEPPHKFLFLYTNKTAEQTEKVCFLLLKQNPRLEIQKQNVPITFDIRNFPIGNDEKKNFNLSGGMSYQVANFVFQYFKYKDKSIREPHLHFIYSERDSIWLLNLSSGEYEEIEPYIELGPLKYYKFKGLVIELSKEIQTY